jgi:hypothetical protein
LKTWASSYFFQEKGKNYQWGEGGERNTYYLSKIEQKIYFFSKNSENILFLAGQGSPCPLSPTLLVPVFAEESLENIFIAGPSLKVVQNIVVKKDTMLDLLPTF